MHWQLKPIRLASVFLSLALALATSRPAAAQADAPTITPPSEALRGVPLADIPAAERLQLAGEDWRTAHPDVAEHYDNAVDRLAEGKADEAVAQLDAALERVGAVIPDVMLLLAKIKQQQHQLGEVRLIAETLILAQPDQPDAHLLLGEMLASENQFLPALAHFKTAAFSASAARPAATAAALRLAQTLEQLGYLRAAADAYQRFDLAAFKDHPEHQEDPMVAALVASYPSGTLVRQIELLRAADQPDEVLVRTAAAVAARPDEVALQRLHARALLDAGRAAEAFTFCTQEQTHADGATTHPTHAAWPLLSLCAEAAIASDQFEAWTHKLSAQLPEPAAVGQLAGLARHLEARGETVRALPLWIAVAEAVPDKAEYTWSAALAERATGNTVGAAQRLVALARTGNGALSVAPDLMHMWLHTEDADSARAVSEKLAAAPDADMATLCIAAGLASAAGDEPTADRLLERARKLDATAPLPYVIDGIRALCVAKWSEALKIAKEAQPLAPHLAAIAWMEAEAHAGLDENTEAEAAYQRAIELAPNEPSYHSALAELYRRLENGLAAQRYYQEAWTLDATLASAAEGLLDTYVSAGKGTMAQQCLERAEASDLAPGVVRRMRVAVRYANAPMSTGHLAALRELYTDNPHSERDALRLAGALFVTDHPAEAQTILEKLFLVEAPHDDQATYLLARVYARRLNYGGAIQMLLPLAERYPRRQPTLALLAELYLLDFRVAEARDVLRRLIPLTPEGEERDRVRVRLLASYSDFQDFDAALRQVDEWTTQDPNDETWFRAKLQVLVAAERDQEAIDLAQARADAAETEFDALVQRVRGATTRRSTRGDDAQTEAEQAALQRDMTAVIERLFERRGALVQTCLQVEAFDVIEPQVLEWLEDQPSTRQNLEWAVSVLLAQKKGPEVLKLLETHQAALPTDPLVAQLWAAHALAVSGNVDRAEGLLTELLTNPAVHNDARLRLRLQGEIIALLVEAEDYTIALNMCARWLVEATGEGADEVTLLRLKHAVLQAAERDEELAPVSERLLELRPDDPTLCNDYGYTLAERGEQMDRAQALIERAVVAEPLNAAYLDSLGWVFYKRGEFAQAFHWLQRATRLLDGQDPVLYDHLGDAAWRAADHAAAEAAWTRAAELLAKEIEQSGDENLRPSRAALRTSLAAKRAALDADQAPAVAPVAAEAGAATQEAP